MASTPWLVVIATLAALSPFAVDCASPNVLVIMPSLNYLTLAGGTQVQVGYYLDEFYWTAQLLASSGFNVIITTPEGNPSPLDPASNASKYFNSAADYQASLNFIDSFEPLNNPVRLLDLYASFDVNDYVGVFVPGGHSPIIDLMGNPTVGSILLAFIEQNKTAGFICHGPLVTLAMALVTQPWPLIGRNMTVLSTTEELGKESIWGAKIGWYPDTLLASHGAAMHEAPPFTSNIVIDGNIVTGQNPQSAEDFSYAFVNALTSAMEM